MIDDKELWACANTLLVQHGDGAPVFVAKRIGALALENDEQGIVVWKAIASHMAQLMARPETSQ